MKRKLAEIGFVCMFLLSLNACGVYRKVDTTGFSEFSEESNGNIGYVYQLEPKTIHVEDAVHAVFGMTMDEAMQYYNNTGGDIFVDGINLSFSRNNRVVRLAEGVDEVDTISCENYNDGASRSYDNVISSLISEAFSAHLLRAYFPLEELDTCTREEAIEACRPYAEVLGYENAAVSTYAITLDILEEKANVGDMYLGAPDPAYEPIAPSILTEQINQLLEEGKDEEAIALMQYRDLEVSYKSLPWEKKHEVILLTYQPYLEGEVMLEENKNLYIIYSPLYEKPVSLLGAVFYDAIKIPGEKELIAQEEAVEKMLLIHGYDLADEIEVQLVSLIYAKTAVGMTEDFVITYHALPYWSIEYTYMNEPYRTLINAIDGTEYR